MRSLILVAALLLAGCASAPREPLTITKEVKVPVPVSCEAIAQVTRDYPDTEAALRGAGDVYNRVRLLLAARILRITDIDTLKRALEACGGKVVEEAP